MRPIGMSVAARPVTKPGAKAVTDNGTLCCGVGLRKRKKYLTSCKMAKKFDPTAIIEGVFASSISDLI